jgi:hypothetical protein
MSDEVEAYLSKIADEISSIESAIQDEMNGQQGVKSHLKVFEHLGHETQKALATINSSIIALGSEVLLLKWAVWIASISVVASVVHHW